jgi:hypothetical protein
VLFILIWLLAIVVAFICGYVAGQSKKKFLVTNRQREGDRRRHHAETARIAKEACDADKALGVEYIDSNGHLMSRCGTCNKRLFSNGMPEWGYFCTEHKPEIIPVAEIAPQSRNGRDVLAEIKRRKTGRH